MICILAEKSKAEEKFKKALENEKGLIFVSASGHLYEYPDPRELGAPADWTDLPWNVEKIQWKKSLIKGKGKTKARIAQAVRSADEVVIATDNDPSGEGTLLAQEILSQLPLKGKKITRMYFADESPKSVQKAFKERKPIDLKTSGEVGKADFRCKWDYLSMQFTRAATNTAGMLLRNGRLKSFMNTLVGDQLQAIAQYKKEPVYEGAFKDENDHWFTSPKAEKRLSPDDLDISDLKESTITIDGSQIKHTAPPKLLDLSTLTSLLRSKDIDPDDALNTYQKMYEDDIVSYPRTEDDFITLEDFNALLPDIDRIADLVGVDKALLTHRTPRNTHLKASCDHGANRPGTNVPNSLDELKKYGKGAPELYTLLAKSCLLMFCEDYEYKQVKAHVTDFPDYVSSINLPQKLGYRELTDNKPSEKDFGKKAVPQIKETVNPKPKHPTMKWLMAQLKKHGVGTGATRTSTYVEMCKNHPLFNDKKGKITLTKAGELNYKLLQGTEIGSCALTKEIQDQMKLIDGAEGYDYNYLLENITVTVMNDYMIMQKNAVECAEEIKSSERVYGKLNGNPISFKKTWGEHTFNEGEIAALLAGETISFETSKGTVSGRLAIGEYKGNTYWGFQADKPDTSEDYYTGTYDGKEVRFKKVWGEHAFSEEEAEALLAGETITFETSKGTVSGALGEGKYKGRSYFGFQMQRSNDDYFTGTWNGKNIRFKKTWSGHTFTDQEAEELLAGNEIIFEAMGKNGKYLAKGKLAKQTYNGRKFVGFKPDFGKE